MTAADAGGAGGADDGAERADHEAVERANQAFYDAVEAGDLEVLGELLLDGEQGESVSVVHPGWPVLRGRGHVLRSYALIMANTDYMQFFLTDVEIAMADGTAIVTCSENILSGGPAQEDGSAGELVGGLVVATNVFRRTPEGWRLWSHHGSPVLSDGPDEEDEGTGTAGGYPQGPDESA
ncbi:nuclear transport factor 2 family protein [Streptomyces sp. PTM05]|uniref:Nuclear transport factor 2 family protein n=1 Tax=Streptantibioticus parmotrematis TaxID=2873249 RepID=A0ABS7QZU8_9ACTN|nr:nuclear transport factor 2 family protein [Streptantibioticus parmotrematis]MBY8888744.1 nuclear transport factor 2 family protein [Streptantibioticus parmotrematis]